MYIFEDGERMYRKRLLKSVQVDSGGGGGGGIPSVIVGSRACRRNERNCTAGIFYLNSDIPTV